MDDNNRIWLLLSRKVSGEASEGDLRELEILIAANPDLQPNIEAFFRMWDYSPLVKATLSTPVKALRNE